MPATPVDGIPRYLTPSVALFEVVDDDLLPIKPIGIQVTFRVVVSSCCCCVLVVVVASTWDDLHKTAQSSEEVVTPIYFCSIFDSVPEDTIGQIGKTEQNYTHRTPSFGLRRCLA